MDAESIPRYVEPTWEELEEMYRDPTPVECLNECIHRDACLRMALLMTGETFNPMRISDLERAVEVIDCDNCLEWE